MNPPWKCVRFAPTEFEIFDEFLKPKVENDVAGLQYSLIENFDLYDEDPIRANKGPHDFFAANNFWFFVTRVRAGPNSLLADRRIRNNPDKGKWLKFGKTRHILRGAENLGCVQTFDYVKNNLKTGWRQHEYTPAVDGVLFQTNAVSHDQDLNALLNDHNLNGVVNVENHGEEDQDLNALLNDHNLNGVGNVENHGEEDQDLNALLENHGDDQDFHAFINGVDNVENLGVQNVEAFLNDDAFDPDDMFQYDEFPVATP